MNSPSLAIKGYCRKSCKFISATAEATAVASASLSGLCFTHETFKTDTTRNVALLPVQAQFASLASEAVSQLN